MDKINFDDWKPLSENCLRMPEYFEDTSYEKNYFILQKIHQKNIDTEKQY